MACTLSGGYTLGCRDSVGGLEFIAIANYATGVTYSFGTDNIITNMSPTASFYKFEQYTEQGLASQEGTFDNTNGTGFHTQTVTITLEDMDAETREKFLILTQARVRIIVKTQTGRYFLVGKVNGARASASTSGPGQAMGDLAGYTLTFTALEPEPAHETTEALALSLIV